MKYEPKKRKPFVRENERRERPAFSREEEEPLDENTVCGRNAVRELLESGRTIDKLLVAKGDRDGSIVKLVAIALDRRIPVIEADRKKLDTVARSTHHQGIVAMAAEREYATLDDVIAYAEQRGEPPIVAILDGVEDPHNLGAIIRSAECCGIHGVIIPKRRSVGLTAVVGKASAGALEHMRVVKVPNLSEVARELAACGFWLYAADMDGTPYTETDLSGKVAIVLGSEGFGISHLLSENCDFKVSIPLYGKVNSMNVSAAAAVLFCEAARQRHK